MTTAKVDQAERIARAVVEAMGKRRIPSDVAEVLSVALLDARANQRTPGCKEVCPSCGTTAARLSPEDCNEIDGVCPLKADPGRVEG